MVVDAEGTQKTIRTEDTPMYMGVKPAADILFKSVANSYKNGNACNSTFTGMGVDGTQGVRELKSNTNCYCITQDRRVVYMVCPRVCMKLGYQDEIVHIDKIGGEL